MNKMGLRSLSIVFLSEPRTYIVADSATQEVFLKFFFVLIEGTPYIRSIKFNMNHLEIGKII